MTSRRRWLCLASAAFITLTSLVLTADAPAQQRDARGRFVRSENARHAFMVQTGYPTGRRGYVIDHIVPLACGGADDPSNMQWQTLADAKAKDRVELNCVQRTAVQGGQPPPNSAPLQPPQTVFLVLDGPNASGLYHRQGCPWLLAGGGAVRSYSLDEAKRRYFQPHCLCLTGKDVPSCESAVPTAQAATVPAADTSSKPATPAVAAVGTAKARASPKINNAVRQQCAAITRKGTRCSRLAQPGSAYCWQHQR